MAHLSSFQSVHLAPGVCVEVWVAARAKALVWVTESASATLATRDSCARAAPTATSERKAPTAAPAPVQVPQDTNQRQIFLLFHHKSTSFAPPPPPPSPCPPLPRAACYHSCKKCAGPEDYKCLDCKGGWMLHDNKCVGECVVAAQAPAVCVCVCVLSRDLVCLLDIDECGTELARCPSNTYCHNTDGSYECKGMIVTLCLVVDLKVVSQNVDVNLLEMCRNNILI